MSKKSTTPATRNKKTRYAVIGLGHIAQIAVLPAFAHSKNSELAALITGDKTKAKKLSKRYGVEAYGYDDLERAIEEQQVDAVYIALPNSMHCEYTLRAAEAGVHVLCEKPLATSEADCEKMIAACKKNGVKLMTAYRLHFNEAHLKTMQEIKDGKIGEPRIFNSVFTYQIVDKNIRLDASLGGGPVSDLGIYCINAARYLFQNEPTEVFAYSIKDSDERFSEVEEMSTVLMKFPKDRLAMFVASFGADAQASMKVVGAKGTYDFKNAYEYVDPIERHQLKEGKLKASKTFKKVDQFAPELIYFSKCIQTGRAVEPDGMEGLLDVRIISAIKESAKSGKPVSLGKGDDKKQRPKTRQIDNEPAIEKPELVNAESASG